MKKVLSVLAVSALVLTASVALAGGPGKKAAGCPEACQGQIDDLNSSQAQQNETLGAHGKQLQNHEGRITALEAADVDPWFVRVGVRAAWMTQDVPGADMFVDQIEVDSDAGWGGALAFGREFGALEGIGKFRAELEIAYQGADLDVADVATADLGLRNSEYNLTTVMVNGYYQIPVADAFSVYVMAGMGYARYELEADARFGVGAAWDDISEEDNAFAYKAGIGVSYDFTDQIAGDLGYEYLGVADTDLADNISGNNVLLLFVFKF
jgi:opacity protein-like surface antigen